MCRPLRASGLALQSRLPGRGRIACTVSRLNSKLFKNAVTRNVFTSVHNSTVKSLAYYETRQLLMRPQTFTSNSGAPCRTSEGYRCSSHLRVRYRRRPTIEHALRRVHRLTVASISGSAHGNVQQSESDHGVSPLARIRQVSPSTLECLCGCVVRILKRETVPTNTANHGNRDQTRFECILSARPSDAFKPPYAFAHVTWLAPQ
ncbi:hypothetical protein IQ06DRAFT_292920 [Phaeosphaeriaceae sp. SRC1lsM3a]|nr:hypothetical protein IQ06DRAFT_292920 [Stagonospora sp. SRC1lsM3a]